MAWNILRCRRFGFSGALLSSHLNEQTLAQAVQNFSTILIPTAPFGRRLHELDGALGLDSGHCSVHIFRNNVTASLKGSLGVAIERMSALLRLVVILHIYRMLASLPVPDSSRHPGGTSCSRPCTCRAGDRTCYYLVVAATTYLSPKRGLEATYQAQKGALSRV